MDNVTLQAIINTLNKITVNGKDNMSMLFGCITVLENELKRRQEEAENEQDNPAEGRD